MNFLESWGSVYSITLLDPKPPKNQRSDPRLWGYGMHIYVHCPQSMHRSPCRRSVIAVLPEVYRERWGMQERERERERDRDSERERERETERERVGLQE